MSPVAHSFIRVDELSDEESEKFIEDVFARVKVARDAFIAHWKQRGESSAIRLIELFDDWLEYIRLDSEYGFIGSNAGIEWKLSFEPLVPYIFIAVADELIRDPRILDGKSDDGTTVRRDVLGLLEDVPEKSGATRHGNPSSLIASYWSFDHMLCPIEKTADGTRAVTKPPSTI